VWLDAKLRRESGERRWTGLDGSDACQCDLNRGSDDRHCRHDRDGRRPLLGPVAARNFVRVAADVNRDHEGAGRRRFHMAAVMCGHRVRGAHRARGLAQIGRERGADDARREAERKQSAEHPPEYTFRDDQSSTRLNRSALVMTDTELKLMAAAAIIGDSSNPKMGYATPAAIGTPAELYTNAKNRFCLMLAIV
jgi:hypothetical protein